MPRSLRAKQFLPFAALKGFSEAILSKEKELENSAFEETEIALLFEDLENVENHY